MKYRVFFPKPDSRGRTLLDYITNEQPAERPYELVYEGEVKAVKPAASTALTLSFLWQRHNVGDQADGERPRAREIRSMCIGDLIELEGRGVFVAEQVGFRRLTETEYPEGV